MSFKLLKLLFAVTFVFTTLSSAADADDNTIPDLTGTWRVEIEEKDVTCGFEKSGLEKYLWEVSFQQRGHTIWAKLTGGESVNDAASGYTFSGIVKGDKVFLFGSGGPDCAYNSFVNGTLNGNTVVGEFVGGDCFCHDSGIYKATIAK